MKVHKKRLKAAVIGVGSMGRHHARNYFDINTVDLVGICDMDEKAGRSIASKFGVKYYKDYKQMVDFEGPDLISLAVPTRMHHPIALDLIRNKNNVLIEKPIAFNISEAQELIYEAKKHKVKLTVGHIERFNPVIIKLREIIKKDKIGTIISIMARRAGVIPNRISDTNVIIDMGVHDIDLINVILKRQPVNIYAYGGRAVLKKQEDYADIFLEYPSGKDGLKVTGHIQANWLTPVKIRKLNVTGTKGYAVVDLLAQKLILFDTKYTQDFDDFEDYIGKFKQSMGRKIKVSLKEPLRAQLESFIDSVANDKPPAVPPEEALWALRTAILATENIRMRDKRL